jgi:hypothetical protein
MTILATAVDTSDPEGFVTVYLIPAPPKRECCPDEGSAVKLFLAKSRGDPERMEGRNFLVAQPP